MILTKFDNPVEIETDISKIIVDCVKKSALFGDQHLTYAYAPSSIKIELGGKSRSLPKGTVLKVPPKNNVQLSVSENELMYMFTCLDPENDIIDAVQNKYVGHLDALDGKTRMAWDEVLQSRPNGIASDEKNAECILETENGVVIVPQYSRRNHPRDDGWYVMWSRASIPLGIATDSLTSPRPEEKNHYHKWMTEVYFCREGEAEMDINNKKVLLTSGMICVVQPGEQHRITAVPKEYKGITLQLPSIPNDWFTGVMK